ncbi:MAG: alpha/beta hydrolase [Agrobacterium cavarae]|uniref:Alpha/beta hydrolase n=1 Tax=Agrobacterium cavarae TaxID=2528239 RepID=A0ABY1Y3Q2_9HYPH|nr:alpha/beta hydrolase [Agrobacterium cavarae]KQR33795.1 esterase [Rhizobium sp. Leaf155]MDP9572703.1 pimeloyl-ACP methyl ester carboxylesterase [Agrobacterium larrymoorei]TBN09436.1 alpha/beta hydrolase [Agrobacterium cavarae]
MPNSFLPMLGTVLAMSMMTPAIAASDSPTKGEERVDVGGFKLNSILLPAGKKADLPPIVFIHGASASLYDPLFSFREPLEGRAKLLFVDRPGHGLSDIGPKENILPDAQADAIAEAMKKRGIRKAIIVGHSFGGAITAAFALRHKDMVEGLVFLSPALYPWPGGISWYYDAARVPVAGVFFSTLIAPPAGLIVLNGAVKGVFAPNPMPSDYVSKTKAYRALRPVAFRHNAQEVGALNGWAKDASANYRQIRAKTIIIAGDRDGVVSTEIHSKHLARDIPGAELIVVHNLGHKSDYVARDLVVAALEKIAGKPRNLKAIAKTVETRIASDKGAM